MNCEEARIKFVDYLGNECSPSEKKLVQAHLAACETCRKELVEISALQSRMSSYFQMRVNQAEPSRQALSQLQTRLAMEAPSRQNAVEVPWLSSNVTNIVKGFKEMLKQPVLAALFILVLMAGTAFSVPAVRAQMQAAFNGWSGFSEPNSPNYLAIKTNWGFTPLSPTRMPKELKLKASMTGGEASVDQLGLCYQPDRPKQDDPFVYIEQTYYTNTITLPSGEPVQIRQRPGSFETVRNGQIRWCESNVTYEEARRLTWVENNVKIEITGTVTDRDLLTIANSMRQADVSTDEKAPTAPTKP